MQPNPRFWMGRRVCVTGGSGFLGYHLVRQLLDLGAEVRTLSLPPADEHPLRQRSDVVQIFGDIRDLGTVQRAVADCSVVFHTAGIVAVSGPALAHIHSVHVDGTRQVLHATDRGALIVHTSSVVTVGASRGMKLLAEESPFNLAGLRVDYVHAKRSAEQLALDAAAQGRRVVITNPAYLLGPEDHERSELGRFCARFWKGQLWLVPPGGFNFADVRDVARGHLLAAERGQPGRRYILGGDNLTFDRFVALLGEVANVHPRHLFGLPAWALTALAALAELPAHLQGKAAFPSLQQARLNGWHWFYRSDRASAELGYQARSVRDCLTDTYSWHTARGTPRWHGLNRWWMRPAEAA